MQMSHDTAAEVEALRWKKYHCGSDGFICLVDAMGDDGSIVSAARVSYGKGTKAVQDDKNLIRFLYRHGHSTPFEMVEFKFLVRVPMDIWRQWIRHRTANVNEYSTRYSEAIDSCAKVTDWRAQSTANKQGSSGFVTEWPEGIEVQFHENRLSGTYGIGPGYIDVATGTTPQEYLSSRERDVHEAARRVYEERLKFGVAREVARKDLPLSNYTEAYWKCDLRNVLNFLSLRMDSHAQLEIREYANAMYEIVKQICPIAIEAFDEYDFRRGGLLLTATEVRLIKEWPSPLMGPCDIAGFHSIAAVKVGWAPPPAKIRERDEALVKFQRLGLVTHEESNGIAKN